MKKFALLFSAIAVIGLSLISNAQSIEGPETTLRGFYQVTEGNIRFTGCVSTGGTCFSKDPTSVQDCFVDGKWIPCGWE